VLEEADSTYEDFVATRASPIPKASYVWLDESRISCRKKTMRLEEYTQNLQERKVVNDAVRGLETRLKGRQTWGGNFRWTAQD
jgi:hypothetical protein